MAPQSFAELQCHPARRTTVQDVGLRTAIDHLVSAKRAAIELDRGPRIPAISTFIDDEIARLERTASSPIVLVHQAPADSPNT